MRTINLTVTCERADWHLATTIADLQALELSREDAEAFANFAFADESTGGPAAEESITDAQWDRLKLDAKSNPFHPGQYGPGYNWIISN